MNVKIISVCVAFFVIFECNADPLFTVDHGSESFTPEEPCSSQGGMCALEDFCPEEDRFPEKGLCPTQQGDGAECCRRIPHNVRDCKKRGGFCIAEADCKANAEEAFFGVCPELDHVCCMLVV
ncbi:U-scoloptoxin(19)-Tl1a-like [Macrobrachium rosenbergii]|uniref:U-scoloptoxin(19)-Tl1a-like n=1 Tax=Macrobrachium rosenbergii TaxID=79674 RepID=UPI0034D6EEF0